MNKPGYRTTEFWLTLLAVLLSGVQSAGLCEPGSAWCEGISQGAAVLAALGYAGLRTWGKTRAPPTE